MSDPAVESKDVGPLAIPFRQMSLSPWTLSQAASGVTKLLWILDEYSNADSATERLLRRLGTVVDISGASPAEASNAMAAFAPQGLVVFSDHNMVVIAELAASLGLPFHSRVVAERLTDKFLQRNAFADHAVDVPAYWVIPEGATDETIEEIASAACYPAVLKPRRGADSRLTFPVGTATDLVELAKENTDRAMIVEEYLTDTVGVLGDDFGNYLSVESLMIDGSPFHFATTGRFPPAPPFRETGFFIPSTIGGELADEVCELASAAISAIGVRQGFLHTEIKMTLDGPRIIEVNGRLGGGIPAMLELAGGTATIQMAMRVALGHEIKPSEFSTPSAVGYRFMFHGPTSATRVRSVEGLEVVSELAGVSAVSLHREVGSPLDWRLGNHDYVFSVLGVAEDHAGVVAAERQIKEVVVVTYD